MTWTEALDLVVILTGHERYRTLCADGHPDAEAYRALVTRKALGLPAESSQPPIAFVPGPCSGCGSGAGT